jgi:glucan phosphoethanolaminetransferase (alkaline phosphatase superfamily)
VLIHDFVPPDTVRRKISANGIPRSRVVNAYYANLILAIREANELINYAIDRGVDYEEIVVTSDHGEMLGELGLYLHQDYDLPQLTIVPWLRVIP